MRLLRRNPTAVLIALVMPVSLVLLVRVPLAPDTVAGLDVGALVVTSLTGFTLILVYHNLVTALVARREELMLKRLRTGETRDSEILAGTAAPAVAIAWGQILIGAIAAVTVFGMRMPANPVLERAVSGMAVAPGLGRESDRVLNHGPGPRNSSAGQRERSASIDAVGSIPSTIRVQSHERVRLELRENVNAPQVPGHGRGHHAAHPHAPRARQRRHDRGRRLPRDGRLGLAGAHRAGGGGRINAVVHVNSVLAPETVTNRMGRGR